MSTLTPTIAGVLSTHPRGMPGGRLAQRIAVRLGKQRRLSAGVPEQDACIAREEAPADEIQQTAGGTPGVP
ncbi:hypothetical protein [Thiocapsa rosea]|uniref:hypothetical protein n=1 Tax=Thiocapsa rosea TaxID=69360 RepID=UPI00147402B6|nr:hypothetical protein [Thiocapsa rosea]